MNYFAGFQRILLTFLVLAVIFPILSVFLFLWGTTLTLWGDKEGATILYGCTAGGIAFWGLTLVVIVLLLALERLVQWGK